ncbi:uncharacterized protein LOC134351056 isoform X1 [Mobula hypostoma]|uniref:uncharacterized protein LOC134351056 isoform X1 n=1 Tax=Mobula hypostoma TaxID=723540 RepID=UPI002FC331D8
MAFPAFSDFFFICLSLGEFSFHNLRCHFFEGGIYISCRKKYLFTCPITALCYHLKIINLISNNLLSPLLLMHLKTCQPSHLDEGSLTCSFDFLHPLMPSDFLNTVLNLMSDFQQPKNLDFVTLWINIYHYCLPFLGLPDLCPSFPPDISHYLGLSGRDMEEDHLTKDALPSAPSYQYNTELNTSVVRDGTDGSARVELFSNSEQDLAMVDRTVQETDDRRASSDSSYTEEHRDLDLSGPAFKRKIFHVHHQLLEALDNLSRSCLTLSESVEESASILCGILPQGLATLQSTMENVTNTLDATVKPSVRESVSPELASLIEAQTSAIQALTCTISSGLERLGGCIDRGFNHVTELLRSAFPYVSDNVESQSHGHGRVGVANAAVSHNGCVPAPLPCPRFQAPPVTETILQSTLRPPCAQTLRDRRS